MAVVFIERVPEFRTINGEEVRSFRETMDIGMRRPSKQIGKKAIVEHRVATTPDEQQRNFKVRKIVD